MRSPIGFVIVTYNRPEQTLFLCERLNAMFGEPPIAIHHDFSQSQLDTGAFPRNVRFVERWKRTRWGSITVVDAQLSALRLLYDCGDPEWFVPLSSFDYPIQTAEQIVEELSTTEFDGFMDSRRIKDPGTPFLHERLGELSFRHPRYHQFAFNRYVAIPMLSPRIAERLNTPVERWVLRSPALTERLTPFRGSFQCYGGDSWFTGNRRVATLLLDETPLWRRLHDHYASRSVPEESFYHTLLGNVEGFKMCPRSLRYTDWRGCYAHPRTLGLDDIPRLLESSDHFARKFPFEPDLLQAVDAAVQERSKAAATGVAPLSGYPA